MVNQDKLVLAVNHTNVPEVFDAKGKTYPWQRKMPTGVDMVAISKNCFGSEQNLKNWIEFVESFELPSQEANLKQVVAEKVVQETPVVVEPAVVEPVVEVVETEEPVVEEAPVVEAAPNEFGLPDFTTMSKKEISDFSQGRFGAKLNIQLKKEVLIEKVIGMAAAVQS